MAAKLGRFVLARIDAEARGSARALHPGIAFMGKVSVYGAAFTASDSDAAREQIDRSACAELKARTIDKRCRAAVIEPHLRKAALLGHPLGRSPRRADDGIVGEQHLAGHCRGSQRQ